MRTRIDIETKTFVRFWLVVIGFVFAIYLLFLAKSALIILASAAFLALALSGPVNRIRSILPGNSRVGASAVAFLIVVAFLISVVFLVVPPIFQQTVRFIDNAPQMIESVSSQWRGVGNVIEKYNLQPEIDQAVAEFKKNTATMVSKTSQNILSSVGSVLGLVAMIFLTLVLTFLMLIEGPTWLQRFWNLYEDNDKMRAHHKLATRIHKVVSGYVTGQLTVSSIGATCVGIVVFLLSLFIPAVPSNLALPAVAISFVLSLIPMFGATIGGTIVALLLAVNSIAAGIIFAIYYLIYQQVENNFISPTIQSKYVELSPLAILAAVTIGLYMFGLAGGIISIPIAGTIKVFVEEYLEHHKSIRDKKRPSVKLAKKS